MNELDFNSLNFDFSSTLNSARAVSEQFERNQRIVDNISRMSAKRDATLMAAAEASVAQKELLEQQLEAVKTQNSLLEKQIREMQERNSLLNDLYENSKKEAADNAKDAKHNKIFGWVSFGIGTLIGIAGIVFGIIF